MKIDQEALRRFAFTVWSYKQGELVSLMIHLGDRLGLYKAMRGAGPLTPAELGARTGLHERWVTEWLRGQTAAQLVSFHEGHRFELTDLQAAVLADDENSVFFAAGAFGYPPSADVVDGLANAFRTGQGLTYDQLGRSAAHRTERMLGPWTRLMLAPIILPALDGVHEKLEQGAQVADVGCGAGVAIISLAASFPRSRFVGFDPSANAIAIARQRVAEAGLNNVELRLARGEELPAEPKFDLVITFDCLHDMTRPDLVMKAIRGAVAENGTWLIKDIRCKSRFEDNLKNPMLALLYGFSVSACMSSALSEPDGLGLGTVGLPPERAEEMANSAGFSRFLVHDFEDPSNLYYEVRP